MELSDFEFEVDGESLQIPEKCKRCPAMQLIKKDFEHAAQLKSIAQKAASAVMEGMSEEQKSKRAALLFTWPRNTASF